MHVELWWQGGGKWQGWQVANLPLFAMPLSLFSDSFRNVELWWQVANLPLFAMPLSLFSDSFRNFDWREDEASSFFSCYSVKAPLSSMFRRRRSL